MPRMTKRTLFLLCPLGLLCCLPALSAAQSVDLVSTAVAEPPAKADFAEPIPSPGIDNLLFDNGPVANAPGAGPGGVDFSVLQNFSLGMRVLGFGNQSAQGARIADDFVIPAGQSWSIETITVYAYQTGSTVTSTMTAVTAEIYDVSPEIDPLASPVAVANGLQSTGWSGAYRVAETVQAPDRPIMANVIDFGGVVLEPGDYWLVWDTAGMPPFTGPFAPPLVITGDPTTGNALQFDGDPASMWIPAIDDDGGGGGSQTQQGFPFQIRGVVVLPSVIEIPTLDSIGLALLALALLAFGVYKTRSKGPAAGDRLP